MDAKYNAKWQMIKGTQQVCITYVAAWEGFIPFETAFQIVQALIAQAQAAINAEAAPADTEAAAQKAVRANIITAATPFVNGLNYIGVRDSDTKMRYALKNIIRNLGRNKNSGVPGLVDIITTHANAHKPELRDNWNLPQTKIDALIALRDVYLQNYGGAKAQHSDHDAQNTTAETLVDDISRVMDKQLDLAVQGLPEEQNVFKEAYENARSINDPAFRHLSVRFKIVDANSKGIGGAIISLQPWGIRKITTNLGGAQDHLTEGSGTATITCNGYVAQTVPVNVNPGQTTDIVVVLEKG